MDTETNKKGTYFSSKMEERIVFFFVAMGVITITLGFFVLIDFLPEKPNAENAGETGIELEEDGSENIAEAEAGEFVSSEPLPITIIFDSLEREVAVVNPTSSTVAELDQALLSGAVRHPDSADFIDEGTIFILGHSSYLPNVINENFQAFNGIQKLEWGDTIRLKSDDMEYIYSVDRVYEAKASSAEVPLQFEEPKLVLATCNSFGTKDDRFIVEASLVMKRPISS